MAKKSFTRGVESLFPSNQKEESKKESVLSNEKSSYSRTTIIIDDTLYEKIKAIAYWERKAIKDIIEKGFNRVISDYNEDEMDKIIKTYKSST